MLNLSLFEHFQSRYRTLVSCITRECTYIQLSVHVVLALTAIKAITRME